MTIRVDDRVEIARPLLLRNRPPIQSFELRLEHCLSLSGKREGGSDKKLLMAFPLRNREADKKEVISENIRGIDKTSPGGQIDAPVMDQYMTTMFLDASSHIYKRVRSSCLAVSA